uniref:Uncharacterized protein n=1 Tax=Setaria viridis TaxID=4556 RepID=A0A4U6VLN0_SETVI|nr:hypothetical protein SEVIR_2G049166v2 [Setaria viridis]
MKGDGGGGGGGRRAKLADAIFRFSPCSTTASSRFLAPSFSSSNLGQ